jgi:uncharacterized protein
MRRAWLRCNGALLIAEPAGALVWPEQALVLVADLHLEKGSALARRGALLPPYDTRSTLARLEAVLQRWGPRRVISLGDGFHDTRAIARLAAEDRRRLADLVPHHRLHRPGAEHWNGRRARVRRCSRRRGDSSASSL